MSQEHALPIMEIEKTIRDFYPEVQAIYLFGSFARGNAQYDSDVDIAVLLPPDPESPLLVRQTLYTGLSRARRSLELWSTPASTERALSTPLARHGRLAQRIVQAED